MRWTGYVARMMETRFNLLVWKPQWIRPLVIVDIDVRVMLKRSL